jgi:hypothetical protein
MMVKMMFRCLCVCFGILVIGACQAEETGWGWGPFSSTKPAASTTGTKSWFPEWKMPDVVESWRNASKSLTSSTSKAWSTTTQSTKEAWNATTTSTKQAWQKTKNGFSGWFKPSPAVDDKPQTVQDFLRQERLQ